MFATDLEPVPRAATAVPVDRDAWRFFNYDEQVICEAVGRVQIVDGDPGSVLLRDVLYLPGLPALYTADGDIIDASCQHHTPLRTRWPEWVPPKVSPPRDVTRVDARSVFVGQPLLRVFGHFVTESVARLRTGTGSEALVCHDIGIGLAPTPPFISRFYDAVGLDRRRFVSFTAPVRFREIVVPQPTFTLGSEAFMSHPELPESVATALAAGGRTTEQPLYLSRTALTSGNRRIVGEERLVETLRAGGFAIAHPEQLTLDEQIDLVNRHDVVVGCRGSALHGILFDLRPRRTVVYVGDDRRLSQTDLMIDAIKSSDAIHIGATSRIPARSGTPTMQIDHEVTIDALRGIGLL